MTTIRARRYVSRRIARLLLVAAASVTLGAAIAGLADGMVSNHRGPGEPLVRSMDLGGADLAHVLSRAGAIARGLGIVGQAGLPQRRFEALDQAVVDEVAVARPDGRILAVLRLEADRGEIRSLVSIGWSLDDDRDRTSAASAPGAAARFAGAIDLAVPAAPPATDWDDAMRAWRVTWPRLIEGLPAPGEGLIVWVYRGGRLAALRRIETPAASAPLLRIPPERALEAARGWAAREGIPLEILTVAAAPTLAWVAPNDFVSQGGADATEARLHLAYTVALAIRPQGEDLRQVLLFVDAGSGTVIGGVESA